jgi:glycosyltransferase involved in cell wall biosynthesis
MVEAKFEEILKREFKKKKSNRLVFGFVGGMFKLKGVDVLIRAFNRVKNAKTELSIYANII